MIVTPTPPDLLTHTFGAHVSVLRLVATRTRRCFNSAPSGASFPAPGGGGSHGDRRWSEETSLENAGDLRPVAARRAEVRAPEVRKSHNPIYVWSISTDLSRPVAVEIRFRALVSDSQTCPDPQAPPSIGHPCNSDFTHQHHAPHLNPRAPPAGRGGLFTDGETRRCDAPL
jgi:hypothetical protein